MRSAIVVTLFFTSVLSFSAFAQNPSDEQTGTGGQYPIKRNDASHPCISPQEYKRIEKEIADNTKALGLDKFVRKTTATTFSWPMQMAGGLTDCSYYFISNYIDEDTTSPGILDYHCGTVTYDGHRGTDIATAPYGFYKMDHNEVNDIAGASGIIIAKSDGFFDKNCAMGSDTANYIIIQHSDGSYALYWHMKKASLTTKIVGASVAAGEFLGVAGSSGSSTGPHLHFEVWANSSSSSLKDPWAGSCNYHGGVTWWASQKPYTEPAVTRVQVNNIPVVLPGCDTTESPNADSCFTAATARFYMFLRNETAGDTVFLSILNPGGSTFSSWMHTSTTSYLASYWWFNRTLPTTPGVYTFKSVYRGVTCSKNFMINCGALGVPIVIDAPQIDVWPNPATNSINVSLAGIDNATYNLTVRNTIGQQVAKDIVQITDNKAIKEISLAALPLGVYFLSVESGNTRIVKKIIKE